MHTRRDNSESCAPRYSRCADRTDIAVPSQCSRRGWVFVTGSISSLRSSSSQSPRKSGDPAHVCTWYASNRKKTISNRLLQCIHAGTHKMPADQGKTRESRHRSLRITLSTTMTSMSRSSPVNVRIDGLHPHNWLSRKRRISARHSPSANRNLRDLTAAHRAISGSTYSTRHSAYSAPRDSRHGKRRSAAAWTRYHIAYPGHRQNKTTDKTQQPAVHMAVAPFFAMWSSPRERVLQSNPSALPLPHG